MAVAITFALVGVGLLFSLFRLILGPSVSDRIIGVDTMNIIIIALIALLALFFNNGMFLDIATAYGILAFVETIVLARYLEGKDHADI